MCDGKVETARNRFVETICYTFFIISCNNNVKQATKIVATNSDLSTFLFLFPEY